MLAIVIAILLALLAATAIFIVIIMLQTIAAIASEGKPKDNEVYMVINPNTLFPEIVCGPIYFKQEDDLRQAEMQVKY